MQYNYTFLMTVFLVSLIPCVSAQSTVNEFGDALNTTTSEIGESISNVTQPTPSIGDALTESSSISNTSSGQETEALDNTTSEIGESISNVTQPTPSIGDALTESSSISNKSEPRI
jgi:predicted PurR-regulated permease PerM